MRTLPLKCYTSINNVCIWQQSLYEVLFRKSSPDRITFQKCQNQGFPNRSFYHEAFKTYSMYIVQNFDSTFMYKVTHKGWNCKDDLKLLKYYDLKIKLRLLSWIQSLKCIFKDFAKKETIYQLHEIINWMHGIINQLHGIITCRKQTVYTLYSRYWSLILLG